MRDIARYQQSVNPLVPKLPFARLVREVMWKFVQDFRIQASALEALQEAAEAYLINEFASKFPPNS